MRSGRLVWLPSIWMGSRGVVAKPESPLARTLAARAGGLALAA